MKIKIEVTFTPEEYNAWCEWQTKDHRDTIQNLVLEYMFRTICNHSINDASKMVASVEYDKFFD